MKTTPSKKTRAKYRRYLVELNEVIQSSQQVSPYTLAKDLGVSNFLPTALRKLNFIVKRGTTSGYFWVWNVRNVTHDQIIDAVIEARTRYNDTKKAERVEEISNKPLKDINKSDLDLWRKRYQSQAPDVTAIPIRTDIYDSATAGEVNYNDSNDDTPPKKDRRLNRAILSRIADVALNLFTSILFKKFKK